MWPGTGSEHERSGSRSMAEVQRGEELQKTLRLIARALSRIEAGEYLETELRNLRSLILDCLDIAGPAKALIQSADELYRLAHECAYEQEQDILLDEEPHVTPSRLAAAEAALASFQAVVVQTQRQQRDAHTS